MRTVLIVCVALIFVVGSVMVFNTSAAEILDLGLSKSIYSAFIKQLIYAVLGCGIAVVVWRVGYHQILKISFPLLCIFTFLLLLVFVPKVGITANGAKRWVGIAGLSIQPSEFVKYLIPVFYIHQVLRYWPEQLNFKQFLRLIGMIAVPMVLIIIEPDNRTTGLIGLTVLVLLIVTKIRFRYWAIPMAVLMIIGGAVAYHVPYVKERMKVYLNPELDLKGKGHQPYQAKIAEGSGQLWGKGLGESLQKFNYLPEAQNDYIVAIFAEETGFIGVLGLILSYMLLTYIGFYIAFHAIDKEGFYLAFAMTFLIAIQAFMNFGVVSGLLPSTGLNLPFFSQGGSSLWVNIIAVTLLLSIDRASNSSQAANNP
jgi:cell division protein FtsW